MPISALAQYRGAYPSEQKKEWVDPAAKPIPQIFSSRVASVKQAKKLDVLYQGLYVSLWNYAITDFVYQRKLLELMRAERFQLTRYPAEFEGELKGAMSNLNENYKRMMSDIDSAEAKYKEIREGIRSMDYATLDPLWEEKIQKAREDAKTYFKMQNKYLQTYRQLVAFILKQGGGYYNKAGENKVYFYKNGALQFFAKSIDDLRMTSYEQKEFLKSLAPANADPEDLK